MSALPPIATKLVRRNEVTLCATSGRERVQQWMRQKAGYSITQTGEQIERCSYFFIVS
jgi:hypothetical protein